MVNPMGNADPSGTDRGVSNVLGYVIIITLILGSITVIVTAGSIALNETMGNAHQQMAKHSMTLFDSRTAMVALGASDTQQLQFSLSEGTFATQSDTGWIAINHINYTSGETEPIFNKSLGAFVYSHDKTEIAYQAGGVWRLGATGDAQMLSPPEFHYRGATLTLPIIRVTGGDVSANSPTVTVESGDTTRIYPSDSTYAKTNDLYQNPIGSGQVRIEIKTPYYEGWATYARQRTTANVTVYNSNHTIRLGLKGISGSPGNFAMPLEGDSLRISGLGAGHPITDFSLTLKADGNFQNAHWSLYSTDNGNQFEMHIFSPGQCSGGSYNDDIDFSIYYHNDSTDQVREWQNTAISLGESSAFDINCEKKELTVNFTDTHTALTYQEIEMSGSSNKWCFGEQIADRTGPDPVTLDQHAIDSSTSYTKGSDSDTMNFTVNHYMSRTGTEFELTVTDGAGNSECLSTGGGSGSSNIDESESSGDLNFKETDESEFLTYLHVTDNPVEVEIN